MPIKEVRVLWLSGNIKERKAHFEKIRAKFGECDHIQCGPDTTFEVFEDQVMQSDCFTNNRLVEVTGLPSSAATRTTFVNRVKRVLDHVPNDCLIVFNGINSSEERAISAYVAKIGKLFEFDNTVSVLDAEGMIIEQLAEHEKVISQDDAKKVVRSLMTEDGKVYDIDHVRLTTEKLALYTGTRKNITSEEVAVACPSSGFMTVWKLFDLLDDKNFDGAVYAGQRLLQCECDGKYTQFGMQLINVGYWRYKLMLFIKEARVMGRNDKDITAEALEIMKLGMEGMSWGMKLQLPEKAAYSAYQIQNMLGNGLVGGPLEKYSRKRLYDINVFLQDAFEQTRCSRKSADFALLIDLFMMLACEKIDDNRRRKLWKFFEHDVRT